MDPFVSLIVPIYGVEPYIEQCARSVLAQTYENVEFIFVNDGTEDASMEILAGVLKDFTGRNVRIVNKENAGLPMARKSGLDVATGDYVMHVDADAWRRPQGREQHGVLRRGQAQRCGRERRVELRPVERRCGHVG